MYLEIFLADFAVFRVFLGISRDFTEIPEFRGSATARNINKTLDFLSHIGLIGMMQIFEISWTSKEKILTAIYCLTMKGMK